MKAKDIIEKMCYDSTIAENANVIEYSNAEGKIDWNFFESMFGECSKVVGSLTTGSYLYIYSDSSSIMDCMPDVIVCLEDGRCIFLYKIEE